MNLWIFQCRKYKYLCTTAGKKHLNMWQTKKYLYVVTSQLGNHFVCDLFVTSHDVKMQMAWRQMFVCTVAFYLRSEILPESSISQGFSQWRLYVVYNTARWFAYEPFQFSGLKLVLTGKSHFASFIFVLPKSAESLRCHRRTVVCVQALHQTRPPSYDWGLGRPPSGVIPGSQT